MQEERLSLFRRTETESEAVALRVRINGTPCLAVVAVRWFLNRVSGSVSGLGFEKKKILTQRENRGGERSTVSLSSLRYFVLPSAADAESLCVYLDWIYSRELLMQSCVFT